MIPRSRLGMAWRFVLAGVLVVAASAGATAVAGLLQVKDVVKLISQNPGITTKQIVLPGRGRAADTPHHRIRSPCRGAVPQLEHRHDAPGAPQRQLLDDQRDVDPPRPAGRHSRRRHLQDQRRLQRGRLRAADQDDQGQRVPRPARQPHRRHQLHRLLGPRGRHRLRLLRRRPSLLQRDGARRRQLLEHRHPAGLSEAVRRQPVRQRRAPVRALPPPGLRHRARSPPAGLHPLGQGPVQRLQAAVREGQAAAHLRQAVDAGQGPAVDRSDPRPVQPGAQLRRQHHPSGGVPGRPAAVHRDLVRRHQQPVRRAGGVQAVHGGHAEGRDGRRQQGQGDPGVAEGPQTHRQDLHGWPDRGRQRRAPAGGGADPRRDARVLPAAHQGRQHLLHERHRQLCGLRRAPHRVRALLPAPVRHPRPAAAARTRPTG